MSLSKITMIGLETALAYKNESLFDLMNLPSGIDKDTVEGNILMEGGEFEVLYADPNFMRQMVGIWTQKHYRTFDKWINALNIEYSPLENYDRMEEWSDTGSETSNRKNNGTLTDSSNGSVHNEGNEHTSGNASNISESDTENKVSAFDSSSYQPENMSENNNTTHSENSEEVTNSNDTTTSNHSNTSTSNNEDYSQNTSGLHKGRTHGNIGVTTSQQMLQSELDIARFNIVQQITDLFLQEFCIMIYS